MSNIDKQALREIAAAAVGAHERLSVMPPDDIFDISLAEGTQLDADITALNALNSAANPATVLALLASLEAAEKRIAELESDSQAQKLVEAIIVAIENEQERLFDEDYLMDSKECIDVIREEVKRWNDSRTAGIRIKGE
ncbi:ead/Ea22-like family protein [Escherichia coli]|uniref:ead/Ea22-like family protein n=1 Tax=Escherichia coli TaxID=562 RepID=UPI0010692B0E|nr:ead/Ea22-like family protein [Escherichia coli]EIH9538704.1 ead/Ea22-like family protein [Escherichia coli]VFS81920.1 putative bacteriophage protein [Escherichia coli]HAI2337309.1 ead/Ea22-like family protein [Escherichia coli]